MAPRARSVPHSPHHPPWPPGTPQAPTNSVSGLANDLVCVEGGEDAPLPRPHVVAPVPVVVLLQLHQDGVVHVQLQLVLVARDEPGGDGQEDVGRRDRGVGMGPPRWPWLARHSRAGCSPEDGAVGLLPLLPVHHAGEQPEGLCACGPEAAVGRGAAPTPPRGGTPHLCPPRGCGTLIARGAGGRWHHCGLRPLLGAPC